MVDIEKILLLGKDGKITQERIDFLLDKHLENSVFGFLTHYGASQMYRKALNEIDSRFKICFADDVANYLDLKEKVDNSIKRYSPYLSYEDKENYELFNKYEQEKNLSIEELTFNFKLYLSPQVAFYKELSEGLEQKEESRISKI